MGVSNAGELDQEELPAGYLWNVNFPDPTEISGSPALVFCDVDMTPLPIAYQVNGPSYRYCGDYGNRDRIAGMDTDVCFSGSISVSLVAL